MYLLEKESYDKVRPMFEKRLEFEMPVKTTFNKNGGVIYVDDIENPKSGYIEMNFGFYYFGGIYNNIFIDSIIKHIMTDIVPSQTLHNFAFIFADSDILKTEIKQRLNGIDNHYENRCYYVLNAEKFADNQFDYNSLPENYKLRIDTENDRVSAIYNGDWVGHCEGGGAVTKTMECDVFLKDEHRNKGIGTLMCAKFIEFNIANSYNEFTWGCWEGNIASCKLAEKLGFNRHYEDKAIISVVK